MDPNISEKTAVAKEANASDNDNTPNGQPSARPASFGETLMGINFNPSQDPLVGHVKSTMANLADIVNANTFEFNSESKKMLSKMALEQLVLAQMAVVKVLTFTA